MVLTTWGVGSAIGLWVVETRDAAKYPTMHSRVPATKNNLGPKVNSGTVKNCGLC